MEEDPGRGNLGPSSFASIGGCRSKTFPSLRSSEKSNRGGKGIKPGGEKGCRDVGARQRGDRAGDPRGVQRPRPGPGRRLRGRGCGVGHRRHGDTFHGPEGYKRYMQGWTVAFSDASTESTAVHAGEDFTIVEFIGRGTHDGPMSSPGGSSPAHGPLAGDPVLRSSRYQGRQDHGRPLLLRPARHHDPTRPDARAGRSGGVGFGPGSLPRVKSGP